MTLSNYDWISERRRTTLLAQFEQRKRNHLYRNAAIAVAVVAVLVAATGWEFRNYVFQRQTSTQSTSSSSITISQSTAPTNNPIKHIVVIMEENRAFDNYFWTFPRVIGGFDQNSTLCMPYNPNDTAAGCMKPWLDTNPVSPGDLPHTYTASTTSYNQGKMNGFLYSSSFDRNSANWANQSLSYYDNQTLPVAWSFASHYTLDDMFFSSVMSYSQPNHWYMVAGTSPQVSIFQDEAQEKSVCVAGKTLTLDTCTYISQAQPIQTIVDLLSNSGLTWKYYDSPLQSNLSKAILDGAAFDYWNVLQAKNSSYTAPYFSNFVWRGDIINDTRNGNLPDVSWVVPAGSISDHPPANVTLGEYWIGQVVDTIMNSSYWNSTAIILSWDDYGGYFDTIAPPVVPQYGFGFRAPAIIISPYAKAGYIDNTTYSFGSILKFIEWKFGLTSLGQQDAVSNNLLNSFDFSQKPLPPYPFPLTQSQIDNIAPCLYSDQFCNVNENPNGYLAPMSYSANGVSNAFIGGDED